MTRTLGGWALRLAAAVAIFLVVGEGLARGLHIVDRMNGYTRALYVAGPDVDLPYLLRPGVQTVLRGVPVRVNALGFRGADFAVTPPPGTRRVLVLGDSVVFGQEMSEEETVAKALERRLNDAGPQRWEVLNGGVSGYDTTAERRFLEVVGVPLHPDVVVLGVSLNDYDPPPMYSPLGVLVNRGLDDRELGWVDRSEFLTLLRWLAQWKQGTLMTQLVARAERNRGDLPPGDPGPAFHSPAIERDVRDMHLAFYHSPDPRHWTRMQGAFATLGRVAAAHGIRLLVAIFPESYQIDVDAPDLEPQRRILGACRDAGVPALDLQPAFSRIGGAPFVDVSHPNARGHAAAAEAIAAELLGR